MSNCLVAFSGETTAISNAILAGLIDANQSQPYYGKVYGALNGIRGLLQERFVDLTLMGEEEKLILQQTPSAALGCSLERLQRDKLSDFENIFTVFQRYDIEALFLIGSDVMRDDDEIGLVIEQ